MEKIMGEAKFTKGGTFSTHNHPTHYWEVYVLADGAPVGKGMGRSKEEAERHAALLIAAPDLYEALENLLTYDRVERPAFRSMPVGAPNSTARIQQEKLIALEDAALKALAKSRHPSPGEKR